MIRGTGAGDWPVVRVIFWGLGQGPAVFSRIGSIARLDVPWL